jgi:hypothetical protein
MLRPNFRDCNLQSFGRDVPGRLGVNFRCPETSKSADLYSIGGNKRDRIEWYSQSLGMCVKCLIRAWEGRRPKATYCWRRWAASAFRLDSFNHHRQFRRQLFYWKLDCAAPETFTFPKEQDSFESISSTLFCLSQWSCKATGVVQGKPIARVNANTRLPRLSCYLRYQYAARLHCLSTQTDAHVERLTGISVLVGLVTG